MNKYFKIGAARAKSMGIPEGTIFPVKEIITNMVGGKGFDASVILDTGDGWFNGEYIGKDVEMFVARGEFVDAPAEHKKVTTNIIYEVKNEVTGAIIKQGTVPCKQGEEYTDLAAIRRVKKAIGWAGHRCSKENEGDAIILTAEHFNHTCIITFHSFGRAS